MERVEGASFLATSPHSTLDMPAVDRDSRNRVRRRDQTELVFEFTQRISERCFRFPLIFDTSPDRENDDVFVRVVMMYECIVKPRFLAPEVNQVLSSPATREHRHLAWESQTETMSPPSHAANIVMEGFRVDQTLTWIAE